MRSKGPSAKRIGLGLMLVALGGWMIFQWIQLDARPPESVVDVKSCLTWLKEPTGAYRVLAGTNTFYVITGPAEGLAPSGPAGYSFDAAGEFIGWSPDIGDVKRPEAVFRDVKKWEAVGWDGLPGQ